jgi:HK97 family phage prohead protease
MKKDFKAIPFELKELKDTGQISGYANVFNVLDLDMDIVQKGAFIDSLETHSTKGTRPKMLWQHDYKQPIGVWTELKEDDHGLYVEGQIAINTVLGKDAYELLKLGAVDSMSIGYVVNEGGATYKNGVRFITKADLWEVSVVTFPANEEAVIQNVKRQMENGETPLPAVFEKILRDAGLSQTQAKAFMSHGYKGIDPREAEKELAKSLEQLVKKFKGAN